MGWLTFAGGLLRAGFGWLGARDARKREERLEQLKMILASERARTRKRDLMGWLFVVLSLSLIVGDFVYTGGDNVEWLMQVFAMALAQ